MNRNLYIQGLRGALSLALFFYHVANSGLPTFDGAWAGWLDTWLRSFEYGVEIFFGVSGIVIVFAFRKSKAVSHFLIDRASRIYPVLWVTVLCIFVLSGFDSRHRIDAGPLVLLGNLFALPPLVPIKLIHPAAWTISYEFLFYMFFVLFGVAAARAGKKLALALVLALGVLFIFYHIRALSFLIGMAVAYIADRKELRVRYAGLAVFGAMLCWHQGMTVLGSQYDTVMQVAADPLAAAWFGAGAVLAFIGLLGVFGGHGLFCRLLVTPVFQWLGALSFSLYMWQAIVMAVVKKSLYLSGAVAAVGPWSQLLFLLVALPPTLVVSRLSQIYLEGHATRWVRAYANKRVSVPPAVPVMPE
jgi:peptidoglycan/LPS O-acetylase OafA/YrhL